jgi:hypothetical protein
MRDIIREDARLVMLRALHDETNYTLNSSLLQQHLEAWGIARPREWVHEELRYLERLGAVTCVSGGSVIVARLQAKGVEHVERRLVIEGVKRPSPPES